MDNLTGFTVELYYRWSGTTWSTSYGYPLFGRKDAEDVNLVAFFANGPTHTVRYIAFNNCACPDYAMNGVTHIDDGLWHHLAVSWDGATMRIYVDHQLDATNAHSGTLGTNTTEDVLICNLPEHSHFAEAELDDVRISSRALDPLEFLAPVP